MRNGIGNPMSTLRWRMLSIDDVMSVTFFNASLSTFTPLSVAKSHLFVKSVSLTTPVSLSVIILIFSELRILHIVDDDSRVLPLKILFSSILLIKVVFPALVSPKRRSD